MAQIFISHSSLDPDQASRLLDWLHANGFTETFLDFDKHAGLAAGSDWERALERKTLQAACGGKRGRADERVVVGASDPVRADYLNSWVENLKS